MTQQSPSRVAPVEWQLVRPHVSVIEDRWGHIWWLEEDSLVASRKHQHSSQQLSSKDGRLAVESMPMMKLKQKQIQVRMKQ